ncbi:MAG: serine hydrolase domain-containing protein [Verrucomicrobiota bacterium]|jgi:CubicO group peptidase (beta-lactamase class C family)
MTCHSIGTDKEFPCPSGVAGTGGPIQRPSGWRRGAGFLALALLGVGLLLAATGCRTFSKRAVSDPTAAAARLRAGGSIGAEVDRLAQPLVDRGEIYGLAVGVVTPDGRTLDFGYGGAGTPGGAHSPDGDTIFQIGSVSKLFITALLAVLVDEGVLRYEDTVRDILPPQTPVSGELGKVTLYELAINTGGLPRQPACPSQLRDFMAFLFTGRNLYAYINKPFLDDYLRKKHVKPKEARDYVYSNIGYGLLAHLIETKTGRPFQELLEEKICRPLHLRDTTLVLNEEQRKRLAVGHAGRQPFFMRRGDPVQPWDMGEIMRPAGCVYSTVNDLLLFAQASLGMPGHAIEPALASTQRAQLRRPGEDVAFGWLINYLGDDRLRVTYKQGVVAGYSAYIGLDTQSHIGVVVLCNTFTWDEEVGHNLILRLSRGLAPARAARANADSE